MSTPLRIVTRSIGAAQRRAANRPLLTLIFSALTAVGLGGVVYFASLSLPWFAASPTADPRLGALNECLLRQVPSDRAGFSVSADAARAATFNGLGVGLCGLGDPGRFIPLSGVTRLAFDHRSNLWIAASSDGGASGLWRLRADGSTSPEWVAEVFPVALAGHAHGAAALDGSGRLVSVGDDGQVSGYFDLPARPDADVELAANADGELLSVVMQGAMWILRSKDLSVVRAESPCDARFVWWLSQPDDALVDCGPDERFGLTYQALTGAQDAVSANERVRSTLVPMAGLYVRACEGLGCSAPAPLP